MKKILFLLILPLVILIAGQTGTGSFLSATAAAKDAASDEMIISDAAFLTAERHYYGAGIQKTLVSLGSPLAGYQELLGGKQVPASEILWTSSQTLEFGINPRVLLVTLIVDDLLKPPATGSFNLQSQGLAKELFNGYSAFENGDRRINLFSSQTIQISANAGTYALARHFGRTAVNEAGLNSKLSEFARIYQTTYQRSARAEPDAVVAKDIVQPFLRLPFNQSPGSFYEVNSFFDHSSPGVLDDYLVRFDGKSFSESHFDPCILAVNCYGGHNALDYDTPNRTPLFAAEAGAVVYKYFNTDSSQGTVDSGIILEHPNGFRTLYWHLDEQWVSLGEQVARGGALGLSGNIGKSSGPHLHFGLRQIYGSKDVDPYGWWASGSDPWKGSTWQSAWMWESDLIADNREPQAQLFYNRYWNHDSAGYEGESWWTSSVNTEGKSTNWAIWGTNIPTAGQYDVYGYWPKYTDNTTSARYKIFHSAGMTTVTINQAATGDAFVLLGSFNFNQGPAAVILTDLTDDYMKRIYFDAVKWEPHLNRAVLISPVNTILPYQPTYQWSAVTNATSYNLWVDHPNGSNLVNSVYGSGDVCTGAVCSARPATTSNLIDEGTYKWWIKPRDSSGAGQWSLPATFTVRLPLPATPEPVSPSGQLTTLQPSYTWKPVEWAEWYQISIDTSTANLAKTWYKKNDVCTAIQCTATQPLTLSGGNYSWSVRSWDTAGSSPWSSVLAFTVPAPPPAPVLLEPAATVTAVIRAQPQYSWLAAERAVEYSLVISSTSAGQLFSRAYTPVELGCSLGGTCRVIPNLPLDAGSYYFNVCGRNLAGNGAWSPAGSFIVKITPPPVAVLLNPSGSIDTKTPVYTWKEVPEAVYYLLSVDDSTANIFRTWQKSIEVCHSGICSATSSIVLGSGSFSWTIHTWNSGGLGPRSEAGSFSTPTPPAVPELISPAGAVSNTIAAQPEFTWKAQPDASEYHLWINITGGAVLFNRWYTAVESGCGSGSGTCSAKPPITLSNGKYSWWLRARNGAGIGNWSPELKFEVALPLPSTPVTISPTITSNTLQPVYTWQHQPESTWYRLSVNTPSALLASKWFQAGDICSGSTCATTMTPVLSYGVTYSWSVVGWNEIGTGAASVPRSFIVIQPAVPSAPVPSSPSGNISVVIPHRPAFQWGAVNAQRYYLWLSSSTGKVFALWYSAVEAGCPNGSGNCAVTPDSSLAAGEYTWWVMGENAAGYGPWSTGIKFTLSAPTPGQALLISPSGQTPVLRPVYSWQSAASTSWYYLRVDRSGVNVVGAWVLAADVCPGSTCSTLPAVDLQAGTPYTWWVIGWKDGVYGTWSAPLSFMTPVSP